MRINMMKSKEQEFLEQLQDPNLYSLQKGVREFIREFNHIIHSVDVTEIDNGTDFREWQVSMYADTHGQVLAMTTMLSEYILEYAPNAKINMRKFDPDTKYCGLFIQSYAVAF